MYYQDIGGDTMVEEVKKEDEKEELRKRMTEKISSLKEEVMDCILKSIPPEVTKHLGNSKKELLMAIRAMLDKEIERTDHTIDRAQELHSEKK